jgi:hypothetical protein
MPGLGWPGHGLCFDHCAPCMSLPSTPRLTLSALYAALAQPPEQRLPLPSVRSIAAHLTPPAAPVHCFAPLASAAAVGEAAQC